MEILSREQAKEQGLKRYYSGSVCRNGHIAERLVSTTRCVLCIKEYKEENKEHIENYRKQYVESYTEEDKEALRVAGIERYAKLKASRPQKVVVTEEQRKANKAKSDKRYRDSNKEHRRNWYETYYASRQGKAVYRVNSNKRRALIEDVDGGFSGEELALLETLHNDVCPCCGESLEDGYHIDHVIPISKGGSNFSTNLQLLCARCNLSKNAKYMEDWLTDKEEYFKWATTRFLFLVALLEQ